MIYKQIPTTGLALRLIEASGSSIMTIEPLPFAAYAVDGEWLAANKLADPNLVISSNMHLTDVGQEFFSAQMLRNMEAVYMPVVQFKNSMKQHSRYASGAVFYIEGKEYHRFLFSSTHIVYPGDTLNLNQLVVEITGR